MSFPKYQTVTVAFNSGAIEKDIDIVITPMNDCDAAIKEWMRLNGMGLLFNYKLLNQITN